MPNRDLYEMRRQPGGRFTLVRWDDREATSNPSAEVSWTALYYRDRLLREARTSAANLLEFAQQGWGGQRLSRADCDKLKEAQALLMTVVANGRVERIKRERLQVIAGGAEVQP